MQREKQRIVIDPFYSTATSIASYQPYLHDIQFVDVHAVSLAGAKYPSSSSKTSLTGSQNYTTVVIGSGSTSFPCRRSGWTAS